LEICKRLGV
ncbi:MAG: hypothetical protein COW39_09520, partial [Comamonadaceae bacterium CG17_big_fil_post_rev_8_21_14_2_50_60_13]